MQYVGYQAEMMLQEIERDAFDEEKELLKKRYEKVKMIKNLCRFCFSNEKDVKCIAMSKLQSYSIDIAEMISILGIDQEYIEAFNDIICANCFDRLLEFSNYRKRCQTAQKDLILSMQDLDRKIVETQQLQRYQRNPSTNWLKVEIQDEDQIDYNFYDADTDKDDEEEDITHDNTDDFVDTTEHYLEDTDDEKTQEYFTEEVDINDDSQKESQSLNLFEITIKNEPHDSDEHQIEQKPRVSTRVSAYKRKLVEEKKEEPSTSKKKKSPNKKELKAIKKIEVEKKPPVVKVGFPPENPIINNKPFGSRKKIHECFFCREKFVGKKTYKTHNCPNKRIKCEVEGCELYFVNQGGYNIHIQRKHGLPKISRHLCPVCRTNYQMSASQYDDHCKRCLEENEYREQPIKCDKCRKIFGTLQSYTAHIQFHDDESLKKASDLLIEVDGKMRKAEVCHMCDLCGRVFRDSYGLKRHQSDVHFLDFTGEMFYCDLCPIAKPTKRLLYNHMKSTHIIRWHSCEICGKVFKNRELWRKHQLVHGDFKKNNLCDYCPHRPGFVTNTALRKHLAKHHGGKKLLKLYLLLCYSHHPSNNFIKISIFL